MRMIYMLIILVIISIKAYPQIDSTDKWEKFNKFKEHLNDEEVQKDFPNNIYKEYFNKKFEIPSEKQPPQIIPIPPARKENTIFILLPLYKQGDMIVRFLHKWNI